MISTFEFFNDEWNTEKTTESNTILPRVDGCFKDAVTGEK